MARIADALKGMTAYLHSENQRLDIEFKEQKVDLAAEVIARKFEQLPPDASLEEMQAMQFEAIGNAAQLGALQENLPLISGMYNSAMQTRSLLEQEKQDDAFTAAMKERLGIDPGQMNPEQTMQLFNAIESSKKDVNVEDAEGRKFLKQFDVLGNETFSMMLSPVTRQQLQQEEFGLFRDKAVVTSDLALRNALYLQGLKEKSAYDLKYGLTGVRQFKGMKFLRTQTTPEKGQLYESSKGDSGLFVLEQGELVSYQGNVIPRGAGESAEDTIDLIQKMRDLNQIERFKTATALATSEEGHEIFSRLFGREISKSDLTIVNKTTGRREIKGEILTELELLFGQDNVPEKLEGLFGKDQLESTRTEFQALGLFGANFLSEKEFERQQFAKLPKSDYSNITNVGEWNRGSALLHKFMNNSEEYAGVAGSVYNYINRKLGRPQNTKVSMADVNSMDFDNQMYLNRQLSTYHKSNLGLEAKVPTLDDITTPRKELKEPKAPVVSEGSISFPKREIKRPDRPRIVDEFFKSDFQFRPLITLGL